MSPTPSADRYSRRQTVANARWFLLGKLLSAAATVLYLGLLTRALLPQGQLAPYLAAIAWLETTLALSLFGLDWLLIRHLPQAAQHDPSGLRRLLRAALLARLGLALLAGLLLALVFVQLGRPVALDGVALALLALLLCSESLLRLLRDTTLESLAAQRHTQLGVLGRSLLALSGLGLLMALGQPIDASTLLAVEATASLFMLGVVARWVRCALPPVPVAPPAVPAATSGLPEDNPGFPAAWRACLPNYLAALISLPLAPQSLTLALSHLVSPALLAPIGLCLRVFEVLRNYVPGLLLMNVLRPRLIGSHAQHGDFARTATEAALISRWSAISVAPLLAWLALYGDMALAQFAGQALMPGSGLMLALMAASLLLRVHRQVGQVMVNIAGQQALLVRLALVGLLGLPLAHLCLQQGWPTWALPLALGVDELAWVIGLSIGMRAWPHQLGFMALLLLLAAGAAAIVAWLPLPAAWPGVLAGTALLPVLMLGVLALLGQLDWRPLRHALRRGD
ncbi:MAG: hypothetical protein J0L58_18390 [Burkholderiales bacterium]|nr:hypothetical protein [Burkholderiales bacterium]